MILLFIIGISLVQFGLYYLNSKYKTKLPNFVILLILFICYFFTFPRLFYPEPRTDGINCGMPILGRTLGFWIFGTIAGIATHIIWKMMYDKTYINTENVFGINPEIILKNYTNKIEKTRPVLIIGIGQGKKSFYLSKEEFKVDGVSFCSGNSPIEQHNLIELVIEKKSLCI